MILLADRILDGAPGQETLGGLDVTVRRNAFGRQVDSFEGDVAGHRSRRAVPRGVHPGAVGREGRPRRRGARHVARPPRSPYDRGGCWPPPSTPRSPATTGCTRCSCGCSGPAPHPESVGSIDRETEETPTHVRPLQVGDHQAQEGRHRRPARQDVRQADQEHRGRGPDGRGRPDREPDALRRHPEGEEVLGPQRQHRPRGQARQRCRGGRSRLLARSCTRATALTAWPS